MQSFIAMGEPLVYMDLQIYHKTLEKQVQCVCKPCTGMGLMGVGIVLSGPTHTVPVWNPKLNSCSLASSSSLLNAQRFLSHPQFLSRIM